MLKVLTIEQVAIIKYASIQFDEGMTVITGETGAGKSILINALQLVMGQRQKIRDQNTETPSRISAEFVIQGNAQARQWLEEHGLEDEDNCYILRRIDPKGKSRAFINGVPVSLSQLTQLTALLVEVSGQHASQKLMDPNFHKQYLDDCCEHQGELDALAEAWEKQKEIRGLLLQQEQQLEYAGGRTQFLRQLIDELVAARVDSVSFDEIDRKHRELAKATQQKDQLFSIKAAVEQISESLSKQNQCVERLENRHCQSIHELLGSALDCSSDAVSEISCLLAEMDLDDQQFAKLEEDLSLFNQLSRKNGVLPVQLKNLLIQSKEELQAIADHQCTSQKLDQELQVANQKYLKLCQGISRARKTYAKDIEIRIKELFNQIGLDKATVRFRVHNDGQHLNKSGMDKVELLAQTNPDHAFEPMHKIASGGEISRICLALFLLCAYAKQKSPITYIFDEADAGISGAVADAVGDYLQKVGAGNQVLCVTHLPQIVCKARHHLHLEKTFAKSQTEVIVRKLNSQQRRTALARMVSGSELSEEALKHADSMLKNCMGSGGKSGRCS